MVTNRSGRTPKTTNRTNDRQIYYENVILAYDDTVGNYLNYDSTDGNNILVQKANNTKYTGRTPVTTNWTGRTII